MANGINNNNDPSYHHFRLFSYLAVTVLSISIILGLFLVFQHLGEEAKEKRNLANQQTLLENQLFLKNITNNLQTHEFAELKEMKHRTEISEQNTKKLDKILNYLNITYP